ncbi:MAG: hypothetical protein R3182_02660, partial [Draconibacterium sp.]|nr:hypothetical protein [Draconibacterium sp.]
MPINKSERQELLEKLNELLKKQSQFQQEINELQLQITQLKVEEPKPEPIIKEEPPIKEPAPVFGEKLQEVPRPQQTEQKTYRYQESTTLEDFWK